tara:strand:+ start:18810 stop:20675 length:1866 start_codon:yes stop_codon:yes gene_type:complete
MSIYYNCSLEATTEDNANLRERNCRFEDSANNDYILNKQNNYQVGVCRFKIPITNVPVYRVYGEDLNLHFFQRGAAMNGNQVDGKRVRLEIQTIFSGRCIGGSYGRYGVDSLSLDGEGKVRPFVDCYSQQHFVDLLNQGLTNSIGIDSQYAEYYNNNNQLSSTPNMVIGAGDGVGALANDGITILGSINKPAVADNANGVGASEVLTSVNLDIRKFANNDATNPIDFSNFTFFLEQHSTGNVPRTNTPVQRFFFNNQILKGLSAFSTTASDAGGGLLLDDTCISFGNGREYEIDAQSMIDNGLYELNKSKIANRNIKHENHPLKMYPTASDMSGLIGSRVDGYDWYLLCRNEGRANNSTAYLNDALLPDANSVILRMATITNKLNNTTLLPNQFPLIDFQLPKFVWDKEEEKIVYKQNNRWSLFFGGSLFVNDNLRNLMTFRSYETLQINKLNYTKHFQEVIDFDAETMPNMNKITEGYILEFPSNILKQNTSATTEIELGTTFDYYEDFVSTYARDWIDSLVITSASIATQGEYVGNGEAIRKVITDFKLDPSTIKRDYLVYEPKIIRYYPLISSAPLGSISVDVFIVDKEGNMRVLKVEKDQMCSVKLEFRPNNMVFQY